MTETQVIHQACVLTISISMHKISSSFLTLVPCKTLAEEFDQSLLPEIETHF